MPMPPSLVGDPEPKRRISPIVYIVASAALLILILAVFSAPHVETAAEHRDKMQQEAERFNKDLRDKLDQR